MHQYLQLSDAYLQSIHFGPIANKIWYGSRYHIPIYPTANRRKSYENEAQKSNALLTFSCLQVCHVLKIAESLGYSSCEIIGRKKPAK